MRRVRQASVTSKRALGLFAAAVFCLTACLASAAEDAGGPSSLLTFAAPRGEVIFAHHWQPGDLPPSHEFQGRGVFGDSLVAGKFLLSPDADGRYRIVEGSGVATPLP